MLTQAIEVTRYCRASAGRAGLQVVFEDVNRPRHDGNTIYLPRITAATTHLELVQLMASTDHEVAHDRFSSFKVLKDKTTDPNGILMFVWNVLEDSRVNMIEAREYRGFRLNWDETTSVLTTTILKRIKEDPPNFFSELVGAMMHWEAQLGEDIFPQVSLAVSSFEPNKEIRDVLNNYSDRLVDCQKILHKEVGTTATYDLALDILTALDKVESLKKLIEGMPKKPSDGEGKDKPGKAVKGVSKPSKGDEMKIGEGESTDPDPEEEYKVIEVVLTKEDLESFSVTMPESGRAMGHVGVNFDPVDIVSGTWDMTDLNRFIVVDYANRIGTSTFLNYGENAKEFESAYNDRVAPLLISQENFAQQVRRIIQIRAKVQTLYGTRKGKLDQARLSRICFEAPGLNEKVFKRKIENRTLDAAVSFLVDMSGSMCGMKAYYALASALLLNEVFTTLGVPFEICGFSDTYAGDPLMFLWKPFSTLKVTNDDLMHSFATSASFMHGNPDGENILWSYDRLLKRRERKRILIVGSDGSPAASKSSHGLEWFTKQVIKEIERERKVDIYGLGLCAKSVESYYKHHSVVMKPEEIPSKLLQLIEKRIISNDFI